MNGFGSPPNTHAGAARAQALDAATTALRSNRLADVERILAGLLPITPRDSDAWRLLGLAQQRRGDHVAAVGSFREALGARPDDTSILNDLGLSLRCSGDIEGAISIFRLAAQRRPGIALTWFNLGTALVIDSNPSDARAAFERSLECDPASAEARIALGDLHKSVGNMDAAIACYRLCLENRAYAPRAWFQLANLKTVRFTADDTAALRRCNEQVEQNDRDRIFCGYALSKALEDQHQYQAAFAVLSAASSVARKLFVWDAPAFSRQIDAIEAAFAQPIAGVSESGFGHEVVFLVSMPRSGSTLVEQILSVHSLVEGAGELPHLNDILFAESKRRRQDFPLWVADATSDDWRRLGEDYLSRATRWRVAGKLFTDKSLLNWSLVGVAAAMLPGARFINCRRDPLETCLSCYRQLFAFGAFFSYDIDELGAYWRDYDRLSRVWAERYPGRFIDAVYEDLLANPEAQTRRMLAFLNLPFDPACLEFHRSNRVVQTFSAAQVRQPLQRDTARAALYGSSLDKLRAVLSAAKAN